MEFTTRRRMLAAGAAGIGTLLAGCLGSNTEEWSTGEELPVASAVQYQGPACDCCDEYGAYLADHVPGSLETETVDDVSGLQAKRGVPAELRSCHLIEVGDYEVLGHVPVEVIDDLLADEPAVQGITLPGMPSGSPGMGGSKDGAWEIYGYTEGGEASVFAEL